MADVPRVSVGWQLPSARFATIFLVLFLLVARIAPLACEDQKDSSDEDVQSGDSDKGAEAGDSVEDSEADVSNWEDANRENAADSGDSGEDQAQDWTTTTKKPKRQSRKPSKKPKKPKKPPKKRTKKPKTTKSPRLTQTTPSAGLANQTDDDEQFWPFPIFPIQNKFELNYGMRPGLHHTDLASINDIESKQVPCSGSLATCNFKDKCGSAPLNSLTPPSRGYVVGGENQTYGEFPSYARLEIFDRSVGSPVMCGGTLITDRHILTAAHCIYQRSKGGQPVMASPGDIKAYLADHVVYQTDAHEQLVTMKGVCVSRKYALPDPTRQTHDDWAVLELSEPVKFNDHIQPACLPFEPIRRASSSATCFLVGSGLLGSKINLFDASAIAIQKLRVEQVSCRAWSLHDRDRTRECYSKARSHNGDSCGGDSGGPILCLDARRRWTVVASVSYGTEFCDGSDRNRAWVGVYARLRTLLSEIKQSCAI